MNQLNFIISLIECFGDSKATKNFIEKALTQSPIPLFTFETVAYRYLILSLTEQEEGYGGWKKPFFDASKVAGVLSWSKTESGAEYYVKKHGEPSRLILLQGNIKALDLYEYSKLLIEYYQKEHPFNAYDKESRFIYSYIPVLNDQINKYCKEEELISLEVISFEIIKDYKI